MSCIVTATLTPDTKDLSDTGRLCVQHLAHLLRRSTLPLQRDSQAPPFLFLLLSHLAALAVGRADASYCFSAVCCCIMRSSLVQHSMGQRCVRPAK